MNWAAYAGGAGLVLLGITWRWLAVLTRRVSSHGERIARLEGREQR